MAVCNVPPGFVSLAAALDEQGKWDMEALQPRGMGEAVRRAGRATTVDYDGQGLGKVTWLDGEPRSCRMDTAHMAVEKHTRRRRRVSL